MNVWIINPYGNLPAENWRPHRSYTVAKAFFEQGHVVSYWISNIDHRSKNVRTASNEHGNNFKVFIVPSTKYSEHISLRRIKFEINFIKKFKSMAEKEDKLPDLILIGEPSLFISFHFISFVKKYKLKFVIDMIDIWPELFKLVLPNFFKPFHKIIFFPFYIKRSWFIKQANGILSVSKAYLKIALNINNNVPSKLIYWGVDLESFSVIDKSSINKCYGRLNIIYAGTLGDNYDIKSIINCARSIKEKKLDIFIYIAGDGNLKQYVLDSMEINQLSNVKYLGRLAPGELIDIYQNNPLPF
jgi:glycosyltransferase involved in cell wall biosynthesis